MEGQISAFVLLDLVHSAALDTVDYGTLLYNTIFDLNVYLLTGSRHI